MHIYVFYIFVLGERQIIFHTMKVNGDPPLTGKTLVKNDLNFSLFRTQNYHMTSESMKYTLYGAVLWCLFFFLYLDRPLSLYEEQCEHFSKRLLSNFTKERKLNGFGMTSGVWMMTFFVIPLINASDIAWLIRICCSKTCFYNHKQHFWDIGTTLSKCMFNFILNRWTWINILLSWLLYVFRWAALKVLKRLNRV